MEAAPVQEFAKDGKRAVEMTSGGLSTTAFQTVASFQGYSYIHNVSVWPAHGS